MYGAIGIDVRERDMGAADTARERIRIGIPDAMLVVAVGVFLVAWAYARSREGLGFVSPLFWTGQLLIFGFVFYRALNPSTSSRERVIVVLLYAGAQSLLRWAFSPYQFTFSDELQHLRALNNVLTTNHLFHTNNSIPVARGYPGLENVTGELVQVSSLSPFVSGVLIAGVAHVLLAGCIVLLLREVSQSLRVACVGAVLYLANPHAAYFDTSFIYQTLALPFGMLAILLAIRFARYDRDSLGLRYLTFFGCLACFAILAMTHHVTIAVTIGLLFVIALATALFRGTRHLAWRLALCAAMGALVYACWVLSVAPFTWDYFKIQLEYILEAARNWRQFKLKIPILPAGSPLFDRVMGPVGVVFTLALLAVSVRVARRRPPLVRYFAWLALGSFCAAVATRVVLPNGAELAGRAFTFTALLSALAIAALLVRPGPAAVVGRHLNVIRLRMVRLNPIRRNLIRFKLIRPGRWLVVATALAIVLFLGQIATSVPAWWQRFPGQFRIDGNPGGIDEVGTSRAEWAATHLTPNIRYFGDVTSVTLLSTLAELDPVHDTTSLYYTDYLTPENAEHIRAQSAIYIDVDMRMAKYPPMNGNYFVADVHAGPGRPPMDIAPLYKFDEIPDTSRIYDSGYARFFDMRGGQGSPYGG